MKQQLKEILEEIYHYAMEAYNEDKVEAQAALKQGHMATYFELSTYLQLADCCWALEKWDEAKKWYRHNALIFQERREWYSKQSGGEKSLNVLLKWETVTLIRAGELEKGKDFLQLAVNYYEKESDSELTLTMLGLHAAQAGITELSGYVKNIVDARNQLGGGSGPEAKQARQLLHYEYAETSLLLNDSDRFAEEVKKLEGAASLVKDKPGVAFPIPLQKALLEATKGLAQMVSIYKGDHSSGLAETSEEAFEEAIFNFYEFGQQLDHDIYFMRLNSRIARDLSEDKPIDPNPFAHD